MSFSCDRDSNIEYLLTTGETSWSSVLNVVDGSKDVGIVFIQKAILKKNEFDAKVLELEKQLNSAKMLSNSCSVAVKNVVNGLKLDFPFAISYYDNKVAVLNSSEDIQIITKHD